MADTPPVTILLLGDPDCGKSTFLARLSRGRDGISIPPTTLRLLHDLEQPFVYDIRMCNRPYRFKFYDTASPHHYTLIRPGLVILCFDINNRRSLENVQKHWRKEVYTHYHQEEARVPVLLIGLKRDLRKEEDGMIWPQEAHRITQEIRCDQYAECSALTGTLMREVFEDIARVAAKTTTTARGQSQGPTCITMCKKVASQKIYFRVISSKRSPQ